MALGDIAVAVVAAAVTLAAGHGATATTGDSLS